MTERDGTFRDARFHSNASGWTKLRLFILGFVCISSLTGSAFAATVVQPVVETDPSPSAGDTADDSVIWIHPTDPSLSLVIGDNKDGGLMVWGLDGKQLQYVNGTLYNNIDLRYNFPLSGSFSNGTSHTHVALVGVGDEGNSETDFFKVNPVTRRLEPAGSVRTQSLLPYGSCMYHSPISGKYYYFVNAKSGGVEQFELSGATGTVTGQMVRTFDVGTQTEGCVADDELGHLYIGEELAGVWKYGAEPGAGSTRTQVDAAGAGRLVADVEGVSIYYQSGGTGYLIVSSQGNSTFAVYTREGSNSYLGSFDVGANGTIDDVSGTDGIDVTNFPLGPAFPNGMLVVHDNANSGAAASNQKFVRWESVANALGLRVDTSWDPRRVGADGSTPPPPPPPPANGQPIANPDSATTTSGSSVTIAVLTNDTDPDNHRLNVTGATQGSGGSVRVNTGSTVTYTANAAYSGIDRFTYTISDGNGGSATGTVTVTVNQPAPPSNRQPIANPDSATTTSGLSVTIPVLANDTDPDNHRLSVTGATQGSGGSVRVNTDSSVTYTANAAYSGIDRFTYTISDGNGGSATGTVTVTVNQPAPPPSNRQPIANSDSATTTSGSTVTIAVLANDTDPDNHPLSITAITSGMGGSVSATADGIVTYTANAAYSGIDRFTYTITDGNGGSATGIVTVTVNQPAPPPNNPPTGPGATEFYFPQIVDGRVDSDEIFRTLIILNNPSDMPATGTLALKLVDAVTRNTVSGAVAFRCLERDLGTCALYGETLYSDAQGVLSFHIAAKGQIVLATRRSASNIVHGYAKVTSDTSIGGMAVITQYEEDYQDDGSVDLEVESQAPVQATGTMSKFAITDFRGDSSTALVLVNPGTEATTVTFRQFASSGTATGGSVTVTLAAGQHHTMFLRNVLPGYSGSQFGMVVVESASAQVSAVALKFDGDEFTIVPVTKIE